MTRGNRTHHHRRDWAALVGLRIGRIVVSEFIGLGGGGKRPRPKFMATCDCGRIFKVNADVTRRVNHNGCPDCRSVRHGGCRHKVARAPEYNVYRAMLARCFNPQHSEFHNYGSRGITVCAEWVGPNGYSRFIEHIGRRPHDELSLDRIDNDRGYEPGNVRWATPLQQSLNTRVVRMLTVRGETKAITEWARTVGVHADTINGRLKRGWSPESALLSGRILRGDAA